jgi:hypothetical protein
VGRERLRFRGKAALPRSQVSSAIRLNALCLSEEQVMIRINISFRLLGSGNFTRPEMYRNVKLGSNLDEGWLSGCVPCWGANWW